MLTQGIDLSWIKSIDLFWSSNGRVRRGRAGETRYVEPLPSSPRSVQAVSPRPYSCSQPGQDWGILATKVLISELSPFSFDPHTGLSMSWGFLEWMKETWL